MTTICTLTDVVRAPRMSLAQAIVLATIESCPTDINELFDLDIFRGTPRKHVDQIVQSLHRHGHIKIIGMNEGWGAASETPVFAATDKGRYFVASVRKMLSRL